jgi:hypothetical protein
MNEVTVLHERAMDLAGLANTSRRSGDKEAATNYFRQAMELEASSADKLLANLAAEPSRSILYRSAASLALECLDLPRAEQLAARGLMGNPPAEIAAELRGVQDELRFQQHLAESHVSLLPDRLSLTMLGNSVGHGEVLLHSLMERLSAVGKLIGRTAERERGLPYREQGNQPSAVRRLFDVWVAAPQPACFEVSLILGRQMSLPGFDSHEDTLRELLDCVELLNAGDGIELQRKIPNEAYYRNFVGLARSIAPDGSDVKVVTLATRLDSQPRIVVMRRSRSEITIPIAKSRDANHETLLVIAGQLLYANAMGQGIIKLKSPDRTYSVHVPDGMMEDVVRPHFGETVTVTGHLLRRNVIRLETIDRSADSDDTGE